MSSQTTTVYRSSVPYLAERINAAAVYCSDGRIGSPIDEFLHQGLGLPRYDRVACPGGPAALAGRLLAFWESRGVTEQVRFLVRVHEVRQVILVSHQGCAYYSECLRIDPAAADAEARADLLVAAAAVQRIDPTLEVATFFAHIAEGAVSYECLFASEAIGLRLDRLAVPTSTAPLEIRLPGRAEPMRIGPPPSPRGERGKPWMGAGKKR
jgi:hypothetical protein